MSGLDVYEDIQRAQYDVKVIMITAYASIPEAVSAMKLGVYDYLTKPFNNLQEVELVAERALQSLQIERENRWLRERVREKNVSDDIITVNETMRGILEIIRKAGPLDSTVLIQGESGTGKELVARALHKMSPRANGPFVAINCASLSETLLESTLFGYEKGAFTGAVKTTFGCFEEAGYGTLFLDEVGDISPKLQASFLRVMQEREFCRIGSFKKIRADFRLIAATNKILEREVAEGRMREDFYYRLNVFPIHLPPLRQRREDIPILAGHFLIRVNQRLGRNLTAFTSKAMDILVRHDWRGNCRELEHTIERIAVTKEGGVICVDDLPEPMRRETNDGDNGVPEKVMKFSEEKERFEREYLRKALHECEGSITKMAELTGIHRQNIYPKLKRHGLLNAGIADGE